MDLLRVLPGTVRKALQRQTIVLAVGKMVKDLPLVQVGLEVGDITRAAQVVLQPQTNQRLARTVGTVHEERTAQEAQAPLVLTAV